jgi:hypothetical protein
MAATPRGAALLSGLIGGADSTGPSAEAGASPDHRLGDAASAAAKAGR